MTNEEKAKELFVRFTSAAVNVKYLLIQMAEWKDQEYKERVKKLEALIKEQKEWQEKDCNHSWECQEAYIEGLKDALEFFI